jgi:hypothetical protein
MTTDYASKLTKLDKDAERIRAKLLELTALRRHLVIDAADNDEAAKRKVLTNEGETAHLQSELRLIDDARAEIEHKQKAEREAQEQEARAKVEKKAAELVIDAFATASLIDQNNNQSTQLHQKLHDILAELKKTNTKPPAYMNRLLGSKTVATAAMKAAGMGTFVDLPHVEPRFTMPYVESLKSLSAIAPAPTAPKRPPPAAPAPSNNQSRYIG